MLYLLLGIKRPFETDAELLLKHVLRSYSIYANLYHIQYAYFEQPSSTQKLRKAPLAAARTRLEEVWSREPGPIIGFGWMPCELLTNRGKTRLKTTAGTRWTYVGGIEREAWVTYDPAGALFSPNLIVDIAAVITAACEYHQIPIAVNQSEPQFNWNPWI